MIPLGISTLLADVLPYGAEAYLRLSARLGEAVWPWQGLLWLAGLGVLRLGVQGRWRRALLGLAAAWVLVAWSFFLRLYAELNWVAPYLAAAFLLQGLLLLALAGLGRAGVASPLLHRLGLIIALGAVLAYPPGSAIAAGHWLAAELPGLHPDPTAIFSLGLVLMLPGVRAITAAALLPALWCLLSGLHWQALDSGRWWLLWGPPLLVALAIAAQAWVARRQRRG